jgi:hypothetical protein
LTGRAVGVVATLLAKVVDAEFALVTIIVAIAFGVVRPTSGER